MKRYIAIMCLIAAFGCEQGGLGMLDSDAVSEEEVGGASGEVSETTADDGVAGEEMTEKEIIAAGKEDVTEEVADSRFPTAAGAGGDERYTAFSTCSCDVFNTQLNLTGGAGMRIWDLPSGTDGTANVILRTGNRNQWLWTPSDGMGIFFAGDEDAAYKTNHRPSNPNEIIFRGVTGAIAAIDLNTSTAFFDEVKAKEITVSSNWADDVFEKDYPLMGLNEVESFISKNGHLPGVPSAKEVQKEGIGLSNATETLLKKVEELTLYTIEQNKRIAQLESKLSARR